MATQTWKAKSPLEGEGQTNNWKLCCWCQEKTDERLVDTSGAGYVTLATNIPEFYNTMPIPFDPKRLDKGGGIQKTFQNNKAKYHESFMLKFKTSNLERKRKSLCKTKEVDDAPRQNSHVVARRQLKKMQRTMTEEEGICFICEKPTSIKDLRLAMTLPLHKQL